MENEMTNLKCRKCGAIVSADQKKCKKCGAPILLKVMMEEEKRHLPAKEIREKDKRMRREYDKINKEKEQKREKEEKRKELLLKKQEKEQAKAKATLEALRAKEEKKTAKAEAKKAKKLEDRGEKKKFPVWAIIVIIIAVLAAAAALIYFNLPKEENLPAETEVETITETQEEEIVEEPQEEPQEEAPQEETPEPQEEAPQEAPQESEPEQKPQRNVTRNNYLFPSDTAYLTEADLNGLSKFDTGLIRNEIYAKKGYVFKDEPYKSYFNSQAWYSPNPSAKMRLNEIEKYNVNFLLEYERSQGWR